MREQEGPRLGGGEGAGPRGLFVKSEGGATGGEGTCTRGGGCVADC